MEHILYETHDADRPKEICDANGEVVLAMCKICGKAEAELGQPCELVTYRLKHGGHYNWRGQPERLIYLGRILYSGDMRTWYQFALVGNPHKIWCEVLEEDLAHMEPTREVWIKTPAQALADELVDELVAKSKPKPNTGLDADGEPDLLHGVMDDLLQGIGASAHHDLVKAALTKAGFNPAMIDRMMWRLCDQKPVKAVRVLEMLGVWDWDGTNWGLTGLHPPLSGVPLVIYDDCLNDLAWDMDRWLNEQGTPTSPRAFNLMKPKLKDLIQKWLNEHVGE